MDGLNIPSWAGKELNAQPSNEMELELLRHFFDSWEALHSIPNDKDHRKKAEAAAECLVGAAHAIRTFRAPAVIERIVNG